MELHDDAVARRPQQERSRERFEKVIAAADEMLASEGLNGFSIPALAEKLGFTRRSIYAFFPTPYAVLNEVTKRYLNRLEKHMGEQLAGIGGVPVQQAVTRMTCAAADFQNANPVARLLILGGAVTDRSYRAQEMNTRHLGQLAARIIEGYGYSVGDGPVHVPTVAIELGTACFRLSYGNVGEITDEFKCEAAYVMLLYLRDRLQLDITVDRQELARYV